jgi:hypothetical protein
MNGGEFLTDRARVYNYVRSTYQMITFSKDIQPGFLTRYILRAEMRTRV